MKRIVLIISLFLLVFTAACSLIDNSAQPDSQVGTPVVTNPTPLVETVQPEPALDPTDGAVEPGASPQDGVTDENFDMALIEAIESKDFKMLRALMGPRFALAGWHSEGRDLSAEDALAELSQTVLANSATPAASTGVDTVALLEGADPLNFFPPDAVRAVFFDFVGPNGTDQALAIIGRDPLTGARYWKGMLVAMGGFRQDGGSLDEVDQFAQDLGGLVLAHDFTGLRALMGSQFATASLDPATHDGSLLVVPADDAIAQLRAGLLAPGSDPVILWVTDIPNMLGGSDPLAQWGPNAAVVRAVHFTSLGVSNQGDAVLVIGREPSGRLYWHGMIVPLNGENFGPSTYGPVGDAQPTSVRYVVALDAINARTGPGMNFAVEGRLRKGEIAQVSGVSADGGWWQFVCSQDSSGRCWVSADASLTQPTGAP